MEGIYLIPHIQPHNFTKVEINVPVDLAHLFRNKNLNLEQLALLLYPQIQDGEISNGKAAEALGISKPELLDFYGELGLPYFNMTEEELDKDIQTLRNLRRSS